MKKESSMQKLFAYAGNYMGIKQKSLSSPLTEHGFPPELIAESDSGVHMLQNMKT